MARLALNPVYCEIFVIISYQRNHHFHPYFLDHCYSTLILHLYRVILRIFWKANPVLHHQMEPYDNL